MKPFAHIFHGNGVENARIDKPGRFGISTTTPTFGQATPITTYDPKLGVEGSIIIGNLSATASDRSEAQFYRRAGSATGSTISNHDMGKIAWYGSSNDANNSNLAWSIGVTADGNDWTSGSNRKGFITFNNHNGEQLAYPVSLDIWVLGQMIPMQFYIHQLMQQMQ